MKNRRFVIIAFLLITVLCLSVGFAAVNDTLFVNGKLSIDADNFDDAFDSAVYFESVSTSNPATGTNIAADLTNPDNLTAEIDTTDVENDTFNITVGSEVFDAVNDQLIVYVGIKNESNTAANVSIAPITKAEELAMFEIAMEAVDGDTTVDAGETDVYKVTITLTMIPTDSVTEGEFAFTLTATPIN